MMFEDRIAAGTRLGKAVREALAGDQNVLVLGIPRGGVVVAAEVAKSLGAPLGVIVTIKLCAPTNPELGIGAIAGDGTATIDEHLVERLRVTAEYLQGEIAERLQEVHRREEAYGVADAPDPSGRTCVVVDDGIATGATARAALVSARKRGASRVVLAIPVGPPGVTTMIPEADEVVVMDMPDHFLAVGQWYREFGQVTDDEVRAALAASADARIR